MQKAILIILDGFGLGPVHEADAIFQANTPCFDALMLSRPHSTLITHGLDVGLPDGQMGNSEVGHINLGAGRIVYQDLTRIDLAIGPGELKRNKVLLELMDYASAQNKAIHLIGLVSDGGVHSHLNHLLALCDLLQASESRQIYIHAITDGRDTDPHAAKGYLAQLENHIRDTRIRVSTVVGRYYAMDRDKRWERTQQAYDLYVHGQGVTATNAQDAIQASYEQGVTDEFIKPILILDEQGSAYPSISDGDVVLCFNFRSDRLRQLTTVLNQESIEGYPMIPLDLHYYTMTEYDKTYKGVQLIFPKISMDQSLGEMLSRYGASQLRIAETEKYPHVTFFFNGGREAPFSGERRILIPSPKVATYDLKPSMSAEAVTDALVADLHTNHPEFVCLNFANTEMVGHTGVFSAAVEAAETVDRCLQRVLDEAVPQGYHIIILADHGNADCMINPDGSPNTAHTKNPVPCILISQKPYGINSGRLCDIAPTILKLMELPAPAVMTGQNLLVG
ncbi:MAG: 2,3-bisphosphoglycerate-independent phosphoglycerate mutase [Saprospiraceae bacterium]